MRLTDEAIEPVHKERVVHLPVDRAFELFTERMGTWWPLTSHSIARADAVTVRFEGWVGGGVIEVASDGTEWSWADVLAWDPPHRFAVAWHPSAAPEAASILDVRFEPDGDGTRVVLEHRGWEEFGAAEGARLRAQYDPGWDAVLTRYEAAADVLV